MNGQRVDNNKLMIQRKMPGSFESEEEKEEVAKAVAMMPSPSPIVLTPNCAPDSREEV